MTQTRWQVHKFWLIRTALIFFTTELAASAVVWFVAKPMFWVGLIGGSLPLTLFVGVTLPLLKQAKQ